MDETGGELRLGAYRKQNLQNRIREDPDGVTGSSAPTAEKLLDPEVRVTTDKKKHGLVFLRETTIYFLFVFTLVLVSAYAIQPQGHDAVALTTETFLEREVEYQDSRGETRRVSFKKVRTVGQVFAWLRNNLFPTIFQEREASGRGFTEYERLFLNYYNRVLGPVRLRQVRVGPYSCDGVTSVAEDLDVRRCFAEFGLSVNEKHPFGPTYLFNGKTGYTMSQIDSLVAQGYGLNVTEVPNTRYHYKDSDVLCSQEPDPARDVGATVDERGRPIMGGNSGLSFWCRVGAGTFGRLGTIYPNGGFVEDFPPATWYKAWSDYRDEKLAYSNEWNDEKGPRSPPRVVTTTVPTYAPPQPPTTTIPLPTRTACGVNVSCTQIPVKIDNNTLTPYVPQPTATAVAIPTTTPVDTELRLPPMPSKLEHSLDHLSELERFTWLGAGTAMLVVEFTLYNANIRSGIVSRMVFEFLPTGAVVPFSSVKILDLYESETSHERGILFGEILLTIWVCYYLYLELKKIKGYVMLPWRHCQLCCMKKIRREGLSPIIVCSNCQRPFHPFLQPYCPDCFQDVHTAHQCWKGYFDSLWNVIDLVNLIIFVVVFGYRFRLRSDLQDLEIRTETQFLQLYPIAWQQGFVTYLSSTNIILSFMKLVKYLGRIRMLSQLMQTIRFSVFPLLNVFTVVTVIILGFSLSFMLAFGSDVYDYRDLSYSIISLFRIWTGKNQFDFRALQDSNEVLANLLFVMYNVWMVFVMTYVILAIVCEAYFKAADQQRYTRTDYLNSALKMLIRNVKTAFSRWTGHNTNFLRVKVLIINLQQVPNLKREQRDDVRAFLRQLDDDPDEEMMHEILKAFNYDVNRVMRMEDYHLMTMTVLRFKQERKAMIQPDTGIWGVDHLANAVPSAPPPQRSLAETHGEAAAMKVQEALLGGRPSTGPSISVRIHTLMGRLDVLEDGLERARDIMRERGNILTAEVAAKARERRRRGSQVAARPAPQQQMSAAHARARNQSITGFATGGVPGGEGLPRSSGWFAGGLEGAPGLSPLAPPVDKDAAKKSRVSIKLPGM
eukprot:Hpha_TRINITY_DN29888_c0_g1::TRINITY_DN29888_c0_g1_i1::g.2886::m.2886